MDTSLFKKTFLPLSQRLFAAAMRLTGNRQSAEDLVQDTFLKLWTMRDGCDKVTTPSSFAATMLRNTFIDQQRRSHILTDGDTDRAARLDSGTDLMRDTENADSARRITDIIATLPEPSRTIITMRDIEGRSYEEIARLTQLTQVNIRVHLSRARHKVRDAFTRISGERRHA